MTNNRLDNSEITVDDIMFVIVLFKMNLADSTTFKTLTDCIVFHKVKNVDLVVYDNSPVSNSPDETVFSGEFNLIYVKNDKNYGVSYCYNRAAKLASSYKKKYLVLLDQDTVIPFNLLSVYISSVNKWKGFPIYVPKLMSGSVLFSPCNYKFYRGSNMHSSFSHNVCRLRGKNVLNSGLVISITAFEKVGGYEESVWLYFSDFVFFNKLKDFYTHFVVVDCFLEHSLSSVDYSDLDTSLKRFKLYVDGAILASKVANSVLAKFFYFFTVLGRSVLMSVRLRNVNFLKAFFVAYLQ
jgi:hypothetical protein